MANSITLTNANVNSGVAMRLLSSNASYKWTNLVKDYPWPGGFSIAPTVKNGWQTPGISISFIIELSNPTSGAITLAQLFALARDATTTKTYLNITLGINDTQFKSYATSASGVASIPVQIVNIDIPIDPEYSYKNDKLLVNMTLLETV